MNLVRWTPVNDMMEMGDLLNRSFRRNGYPNNHAALNLALDLFETEENIVLRATLPGAVKEDITVEFEDQLLTVQAKVQPFELPEGAKSLLQESAHGDITRTLRIPHKLDVENSKGKFTDGVLEVTFPKAPEAKRRSIIIE
jgi:HSP20 family protein